MAFPMKPGTGKAVKAAGSKGKPAAKGKPKARPQAAAAPMAAPMTGPPLRMGLPGLMPPMMGGGPMGR